MSNDHAGPPRAFPRAVVVLVIVSVIVNVLIAITFGIGVVYVISLGQQNAANTTAIHNSQITACQSSNIARARDVAIWNRLLKISAAQRAAETPAQRLEVTQLKALVKKKDTPVNCAALYHAS